MRDWVGSIESAQPREDLVPVGCVSRADGWLGLGLEVGGAGSLPVCDVVPTASL